MQAQILHLLRTLHAELGVAMLLVTHDLGVLAEMADEVAVMYAGRIVEQASSADLFAHPRHPYSAGLLACLPRVERDAFPEPIPGIVPPVGALPAGCAFAPRCARVDAGCTAQVPPVIAFRGEQLVACRHPLP